MSGTKIPKHNLQLIMAATLAVVITSIPWAYLYNQKQHLHTMTLSLNEKQVKSLQQQLEQQAALNQELVNNLADAQEAHVLAKTELAEITAQLSQTEEKLSALDEMDWESKYKFLILDNEALVEKIAEIEFQHEENIERLTENYDQLQTKKEYIEEDFIKLEFKYDDLLEEDNHLKEQHLSNIQHYAEETENLQNNLDKITEELENKKQLVAELQEKNKKIKDQLAQKNNISDSEKPQKKIASADNEKAESTDKDKSFRTARIKSLSAAMLNRNSEERKNILVSVIPNIPDGVTGKELSSLVQGMNSEDILSVIKSTNPHINRPLRNDAFNQLIKTMNKQDAALASNLLTGE